MSAIVEAQSFSVLAPFPIVFGIATGASALAILILRQLTSAAFVVAFSSFLVANLTALLVGSRIGPVFEAWFHRQVFVSLQQRGDAGLGTETGSETGSETGLYQAVPTAEGSRLAKQKDDRLHPTVERALSHHNDKEDRYVAAKMKEPRNVLFFLSLAAVIVLANALGMMIGSWCAKHFPSRLAG